jgi:hypothetical protein
MVVNKCTSVVGHFDGHGDALEQCTQHRPIQHVQGNTEASGCCHQETTSSILPQQPPGSEAKQNNGTIHNPLLVILMAMAMR